MIQLAANQDRKAMNCGFNDLYIINNDLAIVNNTDAIVQSVTSAIWMCLGDSDFNNKLGIPWIQLFNKQPLDLTLINYHLKNAVLSVNDFLSVEDLKNYKIDRDIKISFNKNNELQTLEINIIYKLLNGKILSFNTNNLNLG